MTMYQSEIIAELGVKSDIDTTAELKARQKFLENYLGQTGVNGFVLGISGGQDSLLAGLLAQRAIEARRQAGFEASFHAVLLPYGTQADREDALLAIETISPDVVHDLDIKPATDALAASFELSEYVALPDYHKGNVKARMRMIAQYAIAGQYGLVVLGTDHAAEAVTGFFTKYGDGGADVLPLSGLSKRQGRALLEALDVPAIFVQKKPTADLLDENPGQPDESELALSYDTIDDYLEGNPITSQDAATLESRFEATHHKRSQPVAFTDDAK